MLELEEVETSVKDSCVEKLRTVKDSDVVIFSCKIHCGEIFGEICPEVYYPAIDATFAVSKKAIHRHPKSFYENLIKFNDYLHTHDLKIIKGGRFHHISNNINKGISMLRLVNEYKKYYPSKKFVTIAIGDSETDLEMLNCVDYPCLVKSNDSQTFIKNIKSSNLFISNREAPEGWEDCVNQAFEQIRRQ